MSHGHFIREISVEPALFLYICTYHILEFLNTNLFIQKACRFNRTSEPDLNTTCDDNEKGIYFTSNVTSIYYSISSLTCLVYLILAVCWSDEAGRRRRPLIFLPILGQILQACSSSLHSYFWSWSPSSAALSNTICTIFGGGHELIIAATQMYICDVSSLDSRTMRIGFLWLTRTTSSTLGKGVSGYILRSIGFYYSYLVCILLSLLSLGFGLIFVRNSSTRVVKKVRLAQIFNLTPVLVSFRVVFRKELARKRIVVLLLLLVQVFGWFSLRGETSVIYLYLNYKLHWDEKMYSTFQVYRHAGIIFGTAFCSVVMSKLLKVHDGIIGAFSALCDTIAVVGYALAYQSWHFYVVSLFDVFHGSALSTGSSFMSKFYQSHEFGRLFAVTYVFGLLVPVSYPVYNILFQRTLKSFPSAFFAISIVLNIGIVLSYWISYSLDKKIPKENTTEVEQESMMATNGPAVKVVNYQHEISSQ